MIEEALKIRAKQIDEAIPKFLPITPPDEMYQAMRHLLDARGKKASSECAFAGCRGCGGKT